MSQGDVLTAAQDLLLDLGDPEYLSLAYTDRTRYLAMRCPVFTEVRQISTFWAMGQWVNEIGVYTDDTTDAKDADTNDVLLIGGFEDGDGHMIGAYGLFERVDYTISTAINAATPVTYTYWNGTGWAALTTLTTPTFTVTGVQMLTFVPPEDWAQGIPTDTTFPSDFDANLFWMRVQLFPGDAGINGQDNLESISQAMFLTVMPQGNNQTDMQQSLGLVRIPMTPAPTIAPQATLLQVYVALYPLPATLLRVLTVLYYPNELEPAPVAEGLDLLDPTWRTATSTVPTRYTQDLGPLQRLRLTPMPTNLGVRETLPAWLGIPGFSGGAANNLVVMCDEVPLEADEPPWFEALLSYAIAAQEARRLGETQDLALAQALDGLVDGLVEMMLNIWRKEGMELTTSWESPLRR